MRFSMLWRGIKDPPKALRYARYRLLKLANRLVLTESARAAEGGERLVIESFQVARDSHNFTALAHVQRYEWVSPNIRHRVCLDVGCGSGYGTFHLATNGVASIIGVDRSSKAIEYARKHYKAENLRYEQMDALNLSFGDKSFEAVVSFDVLEHIPAEHQGKFVSEVARVLREQGTAYIGCPNKSVSRGVNPFHQRELTRAEFESLLRSCFREVKVLGQDLMFNGSRLKGNWYERISAPSYENLIIIEDECDEAYGLLAICKRSQD